MTFQSVPAPLMVFSSSFPIISDLEVSYYSVTTIFRAPDCNCLFAIYLSLKPFKHGNFRRESFGADWSTFPHLAGRNFTVIFFRFK